MCIINNCEQTEVECHREGKIMCGGHHTIVETDNKLLSQSAINSSTHFGVLNV